MRGVKHALATAATVTLCALLAACGPAPSDTVPVPVVVPTSTATAAPDSTPTPEPDPDPTLQPQGTALANHAYFDFVNKKLLAVNANPSSAAIVENLVNAGFPKSEIEVTPDRTYPLGGAAASIEVGVRTSKDCLLGQFKGGDYSSAVGPLADGGTCLVGETLAIP